MKLRRGDVTLAFYPFASGAGGGRSPELVVVSALPRIAQPSTCSATIPHRGGSLRAVHGPFPPQAVIGPAFMPGSAFAPHDALEAHFMGLLAAAA